LSRAQIERALQTEIMLRIRTGAWPVIVLPIPNGLWVPTRTEAERALAARLIARMKLDGMLLPGAPDLVLLWAGGGAMVELKRPKARDLLGATRPAGQPSETQAALAARAVQLGIRHPYCSSWDDLRTRLAEWGIGHAA
jgi:hypothetical protein